MNFSRLFALSLLISIYAYAAPETERALTPMTTQCNNSIANDFEKMVTDFLGLPIEEAIDSREKAFPEHNIAAIGTDNTLIHPKKIYVLLKPRNADGVIKFAYGMRLPTHAYKAKAFMQDEIHWMTVSLRPTKNEFLNHIVVRNGLTYLGEISESKNLMIYVIKGAGTQEVAVIKAPKNGAEPIGFDISPDGETAHGFFTEGEEASLRLKGSLAPVANQLPREAKKFVAPNSKFATAKDAVSKMAKFLFKK